MKVKTVLHITRRIGGGAGEASSRLHQALLNNGVDSKLLVLWPEESHIFHDSFFLWAKKNQKIRLFIYQLLSRLHIYNLIFQAPYTSILNICNHPEVKKADLIILHQVDNFINARTFLSKTQDKIICWRCPDFQPLTGKPYPSKLRWIWKGVRFPNKFKWVFTTETARKIALEELPLMNEKSTLTIPNIIPANIINSAQQNHFPRTKSMVFISVNIHDERKGLQHLLEIWPALEKRGYALDVIGDYNFEMSNHEKITYHGSLSSTEIFKILARSLFLITPAKQEMFGQTSIESLICGTPVISTPTIGAMDILTEYENGIFIKCNDSLNGHSILEAIDEFEKTPWNNDQISMNSRVKYHEDKSLLYLNKISSL
jgi:glycosyltransferase involved in cell wall biosynthesis